MTFLDKLCAHKGGLIQLETDLYWYGGRGYDGNPGRVCLLLDATAVGDQPTSAGARTRHAQRRHRRDPAACANLLIDGTSQWVWINEKDVELLVNDQPAN
jgi:hypothetical protein